MPRDPRPYLTYPVGYTTHPRWELHSDAAFRALHEMQDYSRSLLTDGRIDRRVAERRWPKKVLAELLAGIDDRPLLVLDGDVYVLRSYAEHQMTAADVEDLRSKRATAGRKGGIARASARANAEALAKQSPTREEEEKKGEANASPSSEIAIADLRPEIEHLLDLLDSEIVRNGGRAPSRSKKNRDAMRLMLDRDGLTPDQIERAIRWCQAYEFWRSNILSASKLREKYEQLRLAAQRTLRSSPTRQTPMERMQATLALAASSPDELTRPQSKEIE